MPDGIPMASTTTANEIRLVKRSPIDSLQRPSHFPYLRDPEPTCQWNPQPELLLNQKKPIWFYFYSVQSSYRFNLFFFYQKKINPRLFCSLSISLYPLRESASCQRQLLILRHIPKVRWLWPCVFVWRCQCSVSIARRRYIRSNISRTWRRLFLQTKTKATLDQFLGYTWFTLSLCLGNKIEGERQKGEHERVEFVMNCLFN